MAVRELRPRDDFRVDYRSLHLTGDQRATPLQASSPSDGLAGTTSNVKRAAVGGTTMEDASETDALSTWALARHLTEDTVDTLRSNGCDTIPIIVALEPDDVAALGLNVGQRRMLTRAIHDAKAKAPASTTEVPFRQTVQQVALDDTRVNEDTMTAPTLVDLLRFGAPMATPVPPTPVNVDSPEVYLHMAAGKSDTAYYDIVDFVPGEILKSEDSVLATSDGVEIVARATQSKRGKLFNVTTAQWSAANSAIMARLLQDGVLNMAGINQYLNYTYKVSDLGRTYTWQSILQYDREYRQLQARLGFAWGTDISHLRATALTPKQWTSGPTHYKRPPKKSSVGGEGVNVCRDFNKGSCQRPACKFAHRCSVAGCTELQPAFNHHMPPNYQPSAPKN